jgi:spoIIIJ-associated protein
MSPTAPIVEFVQQVVDAMGLHLTATVEDEADGIRINLSGEDGTVLTRRQGEALQALQQIVGSAFRPDRNDEKRLVVDCNGYRRDKDSELLQMATFLAGKAKDTGLAQEMGPLNPYERRIVHMAVAEVPSVASESIGDSFEKTVIISVVK